MSAKDGTNITELFTEIGREAYGKIKKLGEKGQEGRMQLDEEELAKHAENSKGCSCWENDILHL